MRRLLTIFVVVLVIAAAMLLLTYAIPDIRKFAAGMAEGWHLPLFVVGLLAPILYVFNRIGKWLGSLVSSSSEQAIEDKNRELEIRFARLERDVSDIKARRDEETRAFQKRIDALDAKLADQLSTLQAARDEVARIQATPASEFGPQTPDELVKVITSQPGYIP